MAVRAWGAVGGGAGAPASARTAVQALHPCDAQARAAAGRAAQATAHAGSIVLGEVSLAERYKQSCTRQRQQSGTRARSGLTEEGASVRPRNIYVVHNAVFLAMSSWTVDEDVVSGICRWVGMWWSGGCRSSKVSQRCYNGRQ